MVLCPIGECGRVVARVLLQFPIFLFVRLKSSFHLKLIRNAQDLVLHLQHVHIIVRHMVSISSHHYQIPFIQLREVSISSWWPFVLHQTKCRLLRHVSSHGLLLPLLQVLVVILIEWLVCVLNQERILHCHTGWWLQGFIHSVILVTVKPKDVIQLFRWPCSFSPWWWAHGCRLHRRA